MFLILYTGTKTSRIREPQDITNTKSNADGRRQRLLGLSSSDNDINSQPLHSPTTAIQLIIRTILSQPNKAIKHYIISCRHHTTQIVVMKHTTIMGQLLISIINYQAFRKEEDSLKDESSLPWINRQTITS